MPASFGLHAQRKVEDASEKRLTAVASRDRNARRSPSSGRCSSVHRPTMFPAEEVSSRFDTLSESRYEKQRPDPDRLASVLSRPSSRRNFSRSSGFVSAP